MGIQASFTTVKSGEISGSVTAKQLPSIACSRVRLKAAASNAGNVYLGAAGVTAPDGTQDATTGFELDAAEESPWLDIDNLDRLYIICDNAGDDLVYIALDD